MLSYVYYIYKLYIFLYIYKHNIKYSQLLRAAGFPFVAVLTTIDGRTTVCDAHEGDT